MLQCCEKRIQLNRKILDSLKRQAATIIPVRHGRCRDGAWSVAEPLWVGDVAQIPGQNRHVHAQGFVVGKALRFALAQKQHGSTGTQHFVISIFSSAWILAVPDVLPGATALRELFQTRLDEPWYGRSFWPTNLVVDEEIKGLDEAIDQSISYYGRSKRLIP